MLRGAYLVLKVDGSVIAETTSVSMKATQEKLESTSQDTGLYASFTPGKIKIAFAGRFFYSSDWDTLFSHHNGGSEVDVTLYINEQECMNGYGLIKKLTAKGGDSRQSITGSYSIRFFVRSIFDEGLTLLTEAGVILTTEAGVDLITEQGVAYLLNDYSQIMTDDDLNRIYVDV